MSGFVPRAACEWLRVLPCSARKVRSREDLKSTSRRSKIFASSVIVQCVQLNLLPNKLLAFFLISLDILKSHRILIVLHSKRKKHNTMRISNILFLIEVVISILVMSSVEASITHRDLRKGGNSSKSAKGKKST